LPCAFTVAPLLILSIRFITFSQSSASLFPKPLPHVLLRTVEQKWHGGTSPFPVDQQFLAAEVFKVMATPLLMLPKRFQ
jgi:hypothetical protein